MKLDLTRRGWLSPEHARQLDAIADEIRAPYHELIARLSAPHSANLDWWVTPVASRNTFSCDLFLRCCQALLAVRLAQSQPVREIVVDSPALLKTVARAVGATSVQVRCARPRWRLLVAGVARRFGRLAAVSFHCFARFICSRLWPRRSGPPRGPIVLVDTFVYPDSLDAAGSFRDRHFPGILDHLEPQERATVYFTPTFYRVRNYPGMFRRLRAARVNFLLPEDYLRASDYWAALTHPWRVPAIGSGRIELAGVDVGALVREAMALGFAGSGSVEGILRYRFAARLKEQGVKLRLVIEWFENQEIDRGAVAGIRQYYPETPIIGCEGYVVPRHYLCLYPTRQERDSGVIPHRIAVTGPSLVARVREFCPELEVEVMPAFRFGGVWKTRVTEGGRSRFTVLAALPLMARESREILDRLLEACAAMCEASSWHVLIKPHPAAQAAVLLRRLSRRLPSGCELVSGDLDALLSSADVLVSSASSACLQALASGVPVVVLGSLAGLTQNPIPCGTDKRVWHLCYTADELHAVLRRIASQSLYERTQVREIGLALRERLFAPVTRESVARLLRLDAGAER